MDQQTKRDEGDPFVRRYDYDDQAVLAADLGASAENVSVDLLDDRALVVVEEETGSRTEEVPLPEGDAQAVINNGVVTIEVEG